MSIEYSNRFMDFIGTPFRFIISFARFLKESVVTIGTEKEYQGNYGGRCFEDVIKEWASRPVIDEDINGKLFFVSFTHGSWRKPNEFSRIKIKHWIWTGFSRMRKLQRHCRFYNPSIRSNWAIMITGSMNSGKIVCHKYDSFSMREICNC